jgi:hypothetical protein
VIDRIDVYRDGLAVRLRSRESPGTIKLPDDSEPTDGRGLSFPWQTPPVEEMPAILYVMLIVANRNRSFFSSSMIAGRSRDARRSLFILAVCREVSWGGRWIGGD